METPTENLAAQITALAQEFVQQYRHTFDHLPLVESDQAWPSPCELSSHDENLSYWQPVIIEEHLSFDNVEQALNLTLHPDIKRYFTTIFSESIPASCNEGHLQLLFAWSKQDFERLQQNLIGHILMKQKLKQELTLFFAVTDQEDLILTLHNDSGEIWVERVGKAPHKKIADSMADFFAQLQPDIYIEQ